MADQYLNWLETVLSDGKPASPPGDPAATRARASLASARSALAEGDELGYLLHSLIAGQMHQVALMEHLTARVEQRLERIENACPGLGDPE